MPGRDSNNKKGNQINGEAVGERRDREIRNSQGWHHRGAASEECGWSGTATVWRDPAFPLQRKSGRSYLGSLEALFFPMTEEMLTKQSQTLPRHSEKTKQNKQPRGSPHGDGLFPAVEAHPVGRAGPHSHALPGGPGNE